MTKDPCVLVVDRSEETHEVLHLALARHGVRTYFARRAQSGLEMARRIRPDLIVLDLEIEASDPETLHTPFATQSRQNETPLVVLGNARCRKTALCSGEFVRKPYDFAPLVRKIEELLAGIES